MNRIEPKDGYIEANGIRQHYIDWGGSGTPIVILHATGFLGRVYAPIAEALTAVGHVYSCDQRGHGDSGPAPDDHYDWVCTMEDLAGFISAMGLGRVHAFGHSAGASVVGALACERPDMISRAVLAEPVVFESPDKMPWREPTIERTLKRRRLFDSVEAMFRNFERKPPCDRWRKDMLHAYCEYGTRATAEGKRELKCAPEIEVRFYRTSRDFDGLSRILRSDARQLVLFGTNSDSLGLPLADLIAARLRNGRVVKVPDTGHFLPMEKPEETARMAVDFFAEE